jgi:DNA-binding transcriptional MerR regulator
MASQLSRNRAAESTTIPDRLYFKIGDVASICGVETYVLRFWETQFPQLKPNKSGTGQRLYRRREVELALEIKRLVHAEGYTLSGARQVLETGHRGRKADPAPVATAIAVPAPTPTPAQDPALAATLRSARAELREIAALLAAPQPRPARVRSRVVTITPDTGSLFPI